MKILVTGATGNVGSELVEQLDGKQHEILAGARKGSLSEVSGARPTEVDFERDIAPDESFDSIFLMRPPQITDPEPFARFLRRYSRDTRIVFLSVQGAGARPWLPHARIEKRIREMRYPHAFVRASYFMENLLTNLWGELAEDRRIFLPAGDLALDWVSARDVAKVCAAALEGRVDDEAVPVCSGRLLGFADVCVIINRILGTRLRYEPASLWGYVRHERRKDRDWNYIAVMLLLHFLPRFERSVSQECEATYGVLGGLPETLEHFVQRKKDRFARLT